MNYLTATLSNLTDAERHALKVVACERRDLCVERGDHRIAAVFNALGSTVADIQADERGTLNELEADMGPVVRALTPEELAEVRFDDEAGEPS